VSPTPTPTPTYTPTPFPSPLPRIVATQALTFHQRARHFGIPAPFTLWPVTEADFSQNGYGRMGLPIQVVVGHVERLFRQLLHPTAFQFQQHLSISANIASLMAFTQV